MKFFAVLLMEILAGAEVDLFVPSFPELQSLFHLSPFLIQLTLSVNFFSYCVSVLWMGVLGDRFGRKPIILVGLLLFVFGSFFCMKGGSFMGLLLGRFFQGIGIAAPAVLGYVLITDWFTLKEQQKMMGFLNGVCTLAMAFAPVVGSYISLYIGWKGNFFILGALGILCFLMTWFWVPSSYPQRRVQFSLRKYKAFLVSSSTLIYMGAICFLVVPYWVFGGMAPILYMEDLGVSLKNFGFYQGAVAFCFSFVSLTSGWVLHKIGSQRCFEGGMILCMVSFIGILFLIFFKISNPLWITISLCVYSIGLVLPTNIIYPIFLEEAPDSKSMLSALVLFGKLILTSIGVEGAGYFYQNSFTSIGTTLLIFLGISFYFVFLLKKRTNFVQSLNS